MKKRLIAPAFFLLLLCACGGSESPDVTIIKPAPAIEATITAHDADGATIMPDIEEEPSKADVLLESMTLNEKIGQLFIVQPDVLQSAQATEADDEQGLVQALEQYPVGGIVFFANNIESPEQVIDTIGAFQKQSPIPLFVSVDEEGGRVARIAGSPGFDVAEYSSMMEIGASGDSAAAYGVGATIGAYLHEYGFNLDFAPVADVLTNPNNRAIGDRSFGGDPLLVSKMVEAEVEGLHHAGVMSCLKHFPGHGDTAGDTHTGQVSIDKSWEQLLECELIPFINSLDDTDMVMVSHINAPHIDESNLPSSLSRYMIQEKLREELGYDGVVITDSFSMGAITENYTSAESAVLAIAAGADIVLMPGDIEQAFDGITQALNDGILTEGRIDQSVMRILNLKEKYGLLD